MNDAHLMMMMDNRHSGFTAAYLEHVGFMLDKGVRLMADAFINKGQ